MDIYEELMRERREGRRSALATIVNVVGSVPSHTSAKMLVREDGSIVGTIGGGAAEGQAIAAAREVMASGKARLLSFKLHESPLLDVGMVCGGSVDIFVEPVEPPRVVYLFGAGHVGSIVARLAHLIGLAVVVVDDRPEFASRERFPDARAVYADPLKAVAGALRPDANALVFIATRSHTSDTEALAWALDTPAGYIGMIGSRRKILTIYKKLLATGVTEAAFARVHAPVGLDIKAATPEEIAIAVAAEMIAHIRDPQAGRALERRMSECARARASAVVVERDKEDLEEERGAA